LATEIPSTSAYEKLGWLGAVPGVQEWLGELQAKELEDYDYTVRNRDWAAAVPVNENDLDDDQTGVISRIPDYLVQRIAEHPEELLISLLTGGLSGLAYDGIAFFSNATGARVNDNLLGGTGITLAQLEADLNAAQVAMASFKDDQGKILNIKPNTIICPVALKNLFGRLVNSQTDPTAVAQGTFNPYGGQFQIFADARLDAVDSNNWYLAASNEIVKPFIFSKRQAGKVMWEKKNNTKTWIASANYRGNGAYGLPQLCALVVNT
jgi:phage major head subunit gpT-like protein